MNVEIEKKYVIAESGAIYHREALKGIFPTIEELKDTVLRRGTKIRQGYLDVEIGREIAGIIGLTIPFEASEARLRDSGRKYFLTLKSEGGLTRNETPDKEVSETVFRLYWQYAKRRIEKVRLERPHGKYKAEIDVYTDRDLIVAEVEVLSEEIANSIAPLGKDVTDDPDYKNKSLARSDFHRKFILTGGPCSGKSDTINYIESLQYPTIPESARRIIDEQLEKKGDIVPWEKLLEFQLEVLHTSLQAEEELSEWGTIFLDRGIPDGIAYCVNAGVEPPTPLVDAIRSQDYKAVFVLDPLPYENDEARREDPEERDKIHKKLLEMYGKLSFSPIQVPVNLELAIKESVRERAHFIVSRSHVCG